MATLSVSRLSKAYDGVQAVRDVTFSVSGGEMVAMIGPNGAGKTTCFNMLNGQLAPDAGEIRLDGASLVGLQPQEVWRLGVGRTFQVAATFGSMTVRENVHTALLSRERQLWSVLRKSHAEEADALLARVGMRDQADRACAVLAYGDLKRVELAIALANHPRLLLMDEPTAGMAPKERNALMALTKQLVVDRGMAVLFTEHSMDVVFAYADRMIVLARGRLIAQGKPLEIRDHPKVQEVYFGSGKTFEKIAEKAAAVAAATGEAA